jgi:hypothetical protein
MCAFARWSSGHSIIDIRLHVLTFLAFSRTLCLQFLELEMSASALPLALLRQFSPPFATLRKIGNRESKLHGNQYRRSTIDARRSTIDVCVLIRQTCLFLARRPAGLPEAPAPARPKAPHPPTRALPGPWHEAAGGAAGGAADVPLVGGVRPGFVDGRYRVASICQVWQSAYIYARTVFKSRSSLYSFADKRI